jgi:hypothetical protein
MSKRLGWGITRGASWLDLGGWCTGFQAVIDRRFGNAIVSGKVSSREPFRHTPFVGLIR